MHYAFFLMIWSVLHASPEDALRKMQNQIDHINKQDLIGRIDHLEKQYGQLQKQLEEIKHLITQEKSSAPQVTTKNTQDKAPHTSTSSTMNDHALYHHALSMIKISHRSDALASLQRLIKEHPNSKWVSQAYYWIGEIYLQQHKLNDAQKSFSVIIVNYKNSPKYPDALLKKSAILIEQGQLSQARKLLEILIKSKDNSTYAAQARAILKKITPTT